MSSHFQFATAIRTKIATLIKSLSIEQLNKIPDGLNNNLAWHLGHIVVSSEILCYHRTGATPEKEIALANKYRNGTKPEHFITQEEIDSLLERLLSSYDAISKDYEQGVFKEIIPYSTHTFGFELTDIKEVFATCSHHDLLHAGNMMTIRKLV